jgi:hypothetical protein
MSGKGKAFLGLLGLVLAVGVAAAQKNKSWTEWNFKDAQKILDDSGWGQTQTETNTDEMTFSPKSRPITGQGAMNQATSWSFRICFLSAKPIRQAYLRWLETNPTKASEEMLQGARQFVGMKFDQTIVIAVAYSGTDQRFTAAVFQAFNSAVTATLKQNTYLDLKGGKRVFLQDYRPPIPFWGAQFIFPRFQDDKPVIDAKSGDVLFYSQFPKLMGNNQQVILNMRFKVANFIYSGVLEY